MLRRLCFKAMAPARHILIPLVPLAGREDLPKGVLQNVVDVTLHKHMHLIRVRYASQVKQEAASSENNEQSLEQSFSAAKKLFTTLLKHVPMKIILQIISAAEVYRRHKTSSDKQESWERSKFRGRVSSILSRNSSSEQIVEVIMQLFDKTKDQYLNYDFLKNHQIFQEISRSQHQKKQKYSHFDDAFKFDQRISIVNYNNIRFKNQEINDRPLKPSEHFFYDDNIEEEIEQEIEQEESLYDKLLMKSTYKKETEKLSTPEKGKKQNKEFQKIILVNNNEEPLNVEFGEKWVYVYGLPFDLQQEHVDKVIKYIGETEKVVGHQAFSYKQLLEVDEEFYDCEVDGEEGEEMIPAPTRKENKNAEEKLIARSKYNFMKEVNLDNSYMLIELDNVPKIINHESRVFGIKYQDINFKLEYAQYKRSLIIKGIPLGIDSLKLTNILNSKFLQNDFRGLTLTPTGQDIVKNYNSYAILKFNSFWESLKAMEVLSTLKHNGINLKLNHVYGGLKVLNNQYTQNFDEIEGVRKSENMGSVLKQNLESIIEKKNTMEIDITL